MSVAVHLADEVTPVNRTPILMCGRQKRPTLHRYQGEEEIVFGIGEKHYAQMFTCVECGEARRFGLEVG